MSGPANAARGEAKLGDHTLVFDFNALCALEEAMGQPVATVFASMQPGPDGEAPTVPLRTFRALVWAGLQAHHPGTSEQQAGNLIQANGGAQAAADAITAAFAAAMPEAKDGGDPQAAAGGTGSPSSPRGRKKG